MIPNFKFQISNSRKGITLVEIIVVVFLIGIFSSILIANFPAMQKQMALSRVAYKLLQDFRKVQELGFSGIAITGANGQKLPVKGYGIYFSTEEGKQTKYIIYANIGSGYVFEITDKICLDYSLSLPTPDTGDCIIEEIDLTKENSDLYIKDLENISEIGGVKSTSINFSPPDPITNISNATASQVGIVLGLKPGSSARKVLITLSGLIKVE